MADIEELVRKLGDPDLKASADAAKALRDAALKGADMTSAVSTLAKGLSNEDVNIRRMSAEALWHSAFIGVDISAAMPALANALSDAGEGVPLRAITALYHAAEHGADISIATSALAKALSDKNMAVRRNAAGTLEKAIENCASAGSLDGIEARVSESYAALRNGCRYGKETEPTGTGLAFSELTNQIAKRRDALAAKRDVLLEDIPKPPKKGGVYQEMRKVRNG